MNNLLAILFTFIFCISDSLHIQNNADIKYDLLKSCINNKDFKEHFKIEKEKRNNSHIILVDTTNYFRRIIPEQPIEGLSIEIKNRLPPKMNIPSIVNGFESWQDKSHIIIYSIKVNEGHTILKFWQPHSNANLVMKAELRNINSKCIKCEMVEKGVF